MHYVLQRIKLTRDALDGDLSLHKRELRGPVVNSVTYERYLITLYWRSTAASNKNEVFLIQRDGLGEKVFQIREHLFESLIGQIVLLDDHTLFAVLFALYEAQRNADHLSACRERSDIFRAFAQGQLNKRGPRNGRGLKVWITKHGHA